MSARRLLEFIDRDPAADILVVTNMWPDEERPVYGIFVKRQVESLRAAGLRCDVLYLRGYASKFAYPSAAVKFAIGSVVWHGRYQLVHVHAGETALAARFFGGPPMLVSYCGDDVLGDPRADGTIPWKSRLRASVIRGHAHLFGATITKSSEMHFRLPRFVRRKNTVLANGVDTTAFAPIDRSDARRQLGWSVDERVALFAAMKPDSANKRRWLAEEACAAASATVGPIRLHVAAHASHDEMPLLMNAADCLLHTAAVEGSPNVVKEALMCNLPVVATPSGDIAELLEGVEPSYMCAAEPARLADALVKLFRDPSRSNGRLRLRSRLSADAVASSLVDLYGRLAPAAVIAVSEPKGP